MTGTRVPRVRLPWLALAAVTLVAGCGGSGGSSPPVAPVRTPVSPDADADAPGRPESRRRRPLRRRAHRRRSSSFSLSVQVPNPAVTPTSRERRPQYVSPNMASLAVYDGTTLIYVGNYVASSPPQFTTVYANSGATRVTGGSCDNATPNATCTVSVVTSPGSHAFDGMVYGNTQSSSSLTGVILSEGEVAVNLTPGANAGQTIVPLGVADKATFVPPPLIYQLNGTGPYVGIIGTSYTFQYAIDDASGAQIVQPGAYDNAPVTISETDGGGIVTMTPVSQSTPPASTGTLTFHRDVRGQRHGDVHRVGRVASERGVRVGNRVHVEQLLERNARNDDAAMRAELRDASDHGAIREWRCICVR